MRITSVEKNKKCRNMISVYIDNEFSFCIPENMYLKLGLYEKKELTSDEIQAIKKDVILTRARERAILYLQTRIRSVNEVRAKLKAEGYDKETIEAVVEELAGLGYLNDRLFARKYLYDRKKLKPKSKRLLRHELVCKGVDEKIVDEVLSDWKIDDESLAESLVKRKFGKYDLNDEKHLRRVFFFLRRRGFSDETIQRVMYNTGNKGTA